MISDSNPSVAPGEPVDVSVIILSWNTRDYLRRCLSALFRPDAASVREAWSGAGIDASRAQSEEISFEVIVVDQESLDHSADMVAEEFGEVRLIRQRPNVGFAGGNNIGMRAAVGRYMVLLNSDTVTTPGWLTELVRFADADPRAGLIGPRLVNPDGSLQFSCRRFPTLGAGLFRHTPLEWLVPRSKYTSDYLMREWDHATPREVDWLSGACLLARREMVDEIGGLDEGYFMYFEDVDWSRRAAQAGWKVLYTPDPVVIHEIGRSSDRRPRRMIVMHHQSAYRYFCNHSRLGNSLPGRWLLAAGLSARAALTLFRNEVIKWHGRLGVGRAVGEAKR